MGNSEQRKGSQLSLERTVVSSEYIAVSQCAVFPSSSRSGKPGVYSGPLCFLTEDLIHIAQVYKRKRTLPRGIFHTMFFVGSAFQTMTFRVHV